jgi:hypothetical protein
MDKMDAVNRNGRAFAKNAELPAAPAAKMNGNIGKQQLEASTTLPSAARLDTIVRPDPDCFELVSSLLMPALIFVSSRQEPVACRVQPPDSRRPDRVREVHVRIHLSDVTKPGGTFSLTPNGYQVHGVSH